MQDFKTEIKLLGVVTVASIIIAVGGIFLVRQVGLGPSSPVPSPTPTSQPNPASPLQVQDQPAIDTSAWQTYTNSQYGFEIKYPPELEGLEDTWSRADSAGIRFKLPNQQPPGAAAFPYILRACSKGCFIESGQPVCVPYPASPPYEEKEISGVAFKVGTYEVTNQEPGRTWLQVEYVGKKGDTCFSFAYGATQYQIESNDRQAIEANIARLDQILSTFRFTDTNDAASAIEKAVEAQLPQGVMLREVKQIPDVSPVSYLVIYIENPVIQPLTQDKMYLTCPESLGQTIEGIYHLALFRANKIINDVIIPPQYANAERQTQELSYYNTKLNINLFFGGLEPTDSEKSDLVKTPLISFNDYTGDGLRYEFLLRGFTSPCGHSSMLVAGYDKNKDRAVVYPIVEGEKTFYWRDNFMPDDTGELEWFWHCGDHGSPTESRRVYGFQNGSYVLVEETEKECN